MMSESSVRRHMKFLRAFIDKECHSSSLVTQRIVSEAYSMEMALQWVLGGCNWNPSSVISDEVAKTSYD